ncbi:class I SAM-dependent methyltransferase [Microlunatus flavus]|uniref:Methyltransferase domain-containing protein n=1 Tax=Microlunatus flavus TaxID=1036181 RepID=A0A1H9FKQ3_9ACTN|nr:class I SAM-dependent methyltransferase [Microlunatus flavus]SEQ38466.1 Methyltransferase domain-containing protein [Microlunatus flavus]
MTGWGDPQAYAASFGPLCAQTVDAVVEACGPAGRGMFLDVGCGTGALGRAAARAGWRAVLVDADQAMARTATSSGLAPVVVGELPRLPFADDTFDAVGANFVVNHTDDPRAAVRELARVAAPGRRVALTIWPERLIAVNELWNDVMVAAQVEPPPRRALPTGLDFERTVPGLAALVREAGLADVEVHEAAVVLRIPPADLWRAADGGIATIGAVYRAQPPEGRVRMREAFDRITAAAERDGLLVLPGSALLAAGSTR